MGTRAKKRGGLKGPFGGGGSGKDGGGGASVIFFFLGSSTERERARERERERGEHKSHFINTTVYPSFSPLGFRVRRSG
jgi:hypothetical protein